MNQKLLIYRIKKGNKQALEELIHRFYPDIYRYIYLKLTIKEDAKDLCQEVFVRFIHQIPMYRDNGKLINYLYRIAYSVCMDYFRKQKFLDDFEEYENQIPDSKNLHDDVLKQIQSELLQKLLIKLSLSEQDVIVFHFYQQLTFKEIASILNEPEETIKSRYYRSLRKLRTMWKEVYDDES